MPFTSSSYVKALSKTLTEARPHKAAFLALGRE